MPRLDRFLRIFLSLLLGWQSMTHVAAQAGEIALPIPGTRVALSPSFDPPLLKGMKVHPENPFKFEFILDQGQSKIDNLSLKEESQKLVKYFLASITTPEKDLWVNLSPYERHRIVPEAFGQTEMGRDLLAQDYILKQITASLIYPEDELGKKFWKRVYEDVTRRYGHINIPVNTFNKVWIVPEKAVVYENAPAATAFVVSSKLKVLLETDYMVQQKQIAALDVRTNADRTKEIVREIVIPALTKEVNEGKNFAMLRQVYHSLILATWYKKKIKNSILVLAYADQNKVKGVHISDPQEKEKIYERYLQAFKQGAYNFVRQEYDTIAKTSVPRKYFSGGTNLDLANVLEVTGQILSEPRVNRAMVVEVLTQASSKTSSSKPREVIFDAGMSPEERLFNRNATRRQFLTGLVLAAAYATGMTGTSRLDAREPARKPEKLGPQQTRIVSESYQVYAELMNSLGDAMPFSLEVTKRDITLVEDPDFKFKTLDEQFWQRIIPGGGMSVLSTVGLWAAYKLGKPGLRIKALVTLALPSILLAIGGGWLLTREDELLTPIFGITEYDGRLVQIKLPLELYRDDVVDDHFMVLIAHELAHYFEFANNPVIGGALGFLVANLVAKKLRRPPITFLGLVEQLKKYLKKENAGYYQGYFMAEAASKIQAPLFKKEAAIRKLARAKDPETRKLRKKFNYIPDQRYNVLREVLYRLEDEDFVLPQLKTDSGEEWTITYGAAMAELTSRTFADPKAGLRSIFNLGRLAVEGKRMNTEQAMVTADESLGGIDLKADSVKAAMTVENSGGPILMRLESAVLSHLRDAEGFVPIITHIHPLGNLSSFLGLTNKESFFLGT